MMRPTLAMVMNSRAGALLGECGGNLNVMRSMVNEAQERLITDPMAPEEGWWGGWADMVFNVLVSQGRGYIVTPHNAARIIGVNVCNSPVAIKNEFYEYLAFGTGLRDVETCCQRACLPPGVFERGNTVTMADLSGNKQIQVFIDDTADIGLETIIAGEDTNGKPVLGFDLNLARATQGERVVFEYPFTTSANTFSKITGIMKSPTAGQVTYYQYDPATGESDALVTMQPGETTSLYRKYLLSGLPKACYGGTAGQAQVTAKVKLDLVPAMVPQDYLLIQSIPAIIEELQAMRYWSTDDPRAQRLAEGHHAQAIRLLFGQLDHYLGKTSVAINVPIFGSQPLQRQRT